MQTSTIIDKGRIYVTKKNGEQVMNKTVAQTNFVRITDTIPEGEYQVKLMTNSNEYIRNIKIEIKR